MPAPSFESALDALVPPGASASVLATRGGDETAALDPDRCVRPASTAKLVVSALALSVLGPDRQLVTQLQSQSPPVDRQLDGDLVLSGSGAPDLTPADLGQLAASLGDRLDRVRGDLVCETGAFSGEQVGPGRVWTDQREPYGARTSALALSGNVVQVQLTAGAETVTVSASPDTDCVELVTELSVEGTATGSIPPDTEETDEPAPTAELSVTTAVDDGRIHLTGTVPPHSQHTVQAPIHSPVVHCGCALRQAVAEAGVRIDGELRVRDESTDASEPITLATVRSAPVSELLRQQNVHSENFTADQLARCVAREATGSGSWTGYTRVAERQFAALGIDTIRLRDGSGLSQYDRLTARALISLLSWADRQPWSTQFFGSLPQPGEGTLSDRLLGLPVKAKTGTLTGTRALAGQLQTNAAPIFFAALVDDLTVDAAPVRGQLDALVRELAAPH